MKGDPAAQNMLGMAYLRGRGVATNEVEAWKWFTKAAKQGNVDGQGNLAWCYYSGTGVKTNYVEAFKWSLKAVEGGADSVSFMLGDMYEGGKGTKPDLPQAAKWYRKAADGGSPIGAFRLGCLLEKGTGGTNGASEAAEYYQKAAKVLAGKWDLRAYGTDENNPIAEGIGDRSYWDISGSVIRGHMEEGWDGTLMSVFRSGTAPDPKRYVNRKFRLASELVFRLVEMDHSKCVLEYQSGTELFPVAGEFLLRPVVPGERITFSPRPGGGLLVDRMFTPRTNSVSEQAWTALMNMSGALVQEQGARLHRLQLERSLLKN